MYSLSKKAKDRAVRDAKTQVWGEFVEAMEKDFWLASKKFWQTIRQLWKRKQGSAQSFLIREDQLLTWTGDLVGRWMERFEGLLKPADMSSRKEAKSEDL